MRLVPVDRTLPSASLEGGSLLLRLSDESTPTIAALSVRGEAYYPGFAPDRYQAMFAWPGDVGIDNWVDLGEVDIPTGVSTTLTLRVPTRE